MPKEETFFIPQKDIDVTRATYKNLDVMQEKRIDDIGTSIRTKVCLILGKDSQNSVATANGGPDE